MASISFHIFLFPRYPAEASQLPRQKKWKYLFRSCLNKIFEGGETSDCHTWRICGKMDGILLFSYLARGGACAFYYFFPLPDSIPFTENLNLERSNFVSHTFFAKVIVPGFSFPFKIFFPRDEFRVIYEGRGVLWEKKLFFFLFLFFLSCRRLHFLIPLRLIGVWERKSCCTPWFSFFAGGNRKMGLLVIFPPPELCLKYAEITQKPRVQKEINGASLLLPFAAVCIYFSPPCLRTHCNLTN